MEASEDLTSPASAAPRRRSAGHPRSLTEQVTHALADAATYAFDCLQPDGHWCAELRSNPTVTAEYVMMRQALGLDLTREAAALRRWFLREQNADGSFGMAYDYPGDVSTTTEVYFALKLLGVDNDHPAMQRARAFILQAGGVAAVRVFTRIFLAMFGLFPWSAVPQMPAEFILLPPQVAINIYKLACWARGTIVPLLVILHHRPTFALPNGTSPDNPYLDELWRDPTDKQVPYAPPLRRVWAAHGLSWAFAFTVADKLVGLMGGLRRSPLRRRALDRCVAWILERQEASGDWAGIFPPMLNNLLALPLEGYGLDSDCMTRGLAAMDRFALQDDTGRRVQACVSPMWDTLLMSVALCDAGWPGEDRRLQRACDWLRARQLLGPEGDWRVYRPNLPPGGWSFEYDNAWYPDIDDTAAVLLALVKQDPLGTRTSLDCLVRALEWILGMQNPDGGWGAFDVENDKLFLNDIPFADMGALCDPSTPDVTGRIIEAFGLVAQSPQRHRLPVRLLAQLHEASERAVTYLGITQETSGAWWGRWGVNYLYGTSNVVCGLTRTQDARAAELCRRARRWLVRVQNDDGGWGEGLDTYLDPSRAGCGVSTASQTAWALMGLIPQVGCRPSDDATGIDAAVERGVTWLVAAQTERRGKGATWPEPQTTATGFPGHFYVRYDMYRHYFPIMALGRYAASRLPQST